LPRRTSQNSVLAKFAEQAFHALRRIELKTAQFVILWECL
jgi:hypothetical protein